MRMTMSGCYTLRLCACVCLLYTTKTVAKNYIIKSGGSDFQELFKFCEGVRVSVCQCVWRALNRFSFAFILYIVVVFVAVLLFLRSLWCALSGCMRHSQSYTHTRLCTLAHVCVHSPSEGQRCFLPLVMGCCANIIKVFFLFYFLFLWPLEKSN